MEVAGDIFSLVFEKIFLIIVWLGEDGVDSSRKSSQDGLVAAQARNDGSLGKVGGSDGKRHPRGKINSAWCVCSYYHLQASSSVNLMGAWR